MTGNHNDNSPSSGINSRLERRSFMRAAGAIGGAGILGVSFTGTAVADDLTIDFANWRVQEAQNAWEKGFRGQPNRTIGLLGHGLEARHPDLGPWNGVRAVPEGEESLKLVRENLERIHGSDDIRQFSGSFGPNAGTERNVHGPFTAPEGVDRMEAHLGPAFPGFVSRALLFKFETHPEGEVIVQFQGKSPHSAISTWDIEPGEQYRFAVETTFPNNAAAFYLIEANYQKQTADTETVTDPFANVNPDNITADTPKVVGWYNEDWELSEATAKPHPGPRGPSSNPRGRSTSLASIMTGSGRASAADEDSVIQEEPDMILEPGNELTYEFDLEPDRGLYGSVHGDNVELTVRGPDGSRLETTTHGYRESGAYRQNLTAESPAIHQSGTQTYKVVIKSTKRHYHTFSPAGTVRQPSTPARVKRLSVGKFKNPNNTAGDRTTEDSPTLHAGIAPNSGLVGLSGMYKTRESLKFLADDFAELFNLRALHIAMGFDVRPGHAAGKFSTPEAMKAVAEAGILPVSQTDDVAPASQGDRVAANADESISVVQAGPHDGVWEGSEPAEPPVVDEDDQGVYLKPDVTAIGGNYLNIVKCAKMGNGFDAESDQATPIRDYKRYGTVRQAPIVVGQASLVAQALEEQAPEEISIPAPKDAGFQDTMRLKQTILATASETPFTAAPWHRHKPAYNFGAHDTVEGWGRVNIDASVDAPSRNLTPNSQSTVGKVPNSGRRGKASRRKRSKNRLTIKDTVGLDIPRHSRAVAGYISADRGVYKVSVDFTKYTGKKSDLAGGPPHIDLFIYDAENPGQHGTPNIVAKAQAIAGSASLEFTPNNQNQKGKGGGTYYVVAKLVNVPGAFNSVDIRAHIELSVKRGG